MPWWHRHLGFLERKFLFQKYGKFWSFSLCHFIKHKPLISEEWPLRKYIFKCRKKSILKDNWKEPGLMIIPKIKKLLASRRTSWVVMDKVSKIGFARPEINARKWVEPRSWTWLFSFFAKFLPYLWWFF